MWLIFADFFFDFSTQISTLRSQRSRARPLKSRVICPYIINPSGLVPAPELLRGYKIALSGL